MRSGSKIHNIGGFTLIEMLIVLIIVGIMTMFTIGMSGSQIQKVKEKTIKESILAEWQSRYSRNLGSSSYSHTMYKYMDISIEKGGNSLEFKYTPRSDNDNPVINNFVDRFTIKSIIVDTTPALPKDTENLTIRYYPYQIGCERGNVDNEGVLSTGDMREDLVLIYHVNDSKNYCFEINKKNCRLREISDCEENFENFIK